MINKILMSAIVIPAVVLSAYVITEADTKPDPVRMQRHIDEVKITHPAKYQEMLDKAGGVIVDCLSCHNDMKTKRLPSEYKYPRHPKRY